MADIWEKRIRQAIKASRLSIYRLAKDSGLRVGQIQRFVKGSSLTLRCARPLCQRLGLDLVRVAEPGKGV